ncbi:hypothetical protein L3Q82_003720 [Xyrichtys novacula]|uniref:Uncharacterized protein n=1 Tax=Xyrichtys novacula TaxID=13765 RepID=A0AAV1GJU0_XYRNO|nr:hypothetical protein L3Q82_003720 [Xyrichtys novacula]
MLSDSADESMRKVNSDDFMEEGMSDDELLKVSQKRKNIESVKKNKKTRKPIMRKTPESESDFSFTQDSQSPYSPAQIKTFLAQIKGSRLPNVREYFPDLRSFMKSARPLTRKSHGEEVLTEQEVFRLKKVLQRVKEQFISDEDEF